MQTNTERQTETETDRETDKQMDKSIALSRSRCRERWLNNVDVYKITNTYRLNNRFCDKHDIKYDYTTEYNGAGSRPEFYT